MWAVQFPDWNPAQAIYDEEDIWQRHTALTNVFSDPEGRDAAAIDWNNNNKKSKKKTKTVAGPGYSKAPGMKVHAACQTGSP